MKKKRRLSRKFWGDKIVRISHIGSSAVEGLMAKPTVDILLEIKEDADIAAMTKTMAEKGYLVNNPANDLLTYLKGYGPQGFVGQVFHIHVRHSGDYGELYFRDYLIAHPEAAKQYEKLKLFLKTQYEFDRDGYTAAKGAFIGKVTALAREEFKNKYEPFPVYSSSKTQQNF